MKRSSMVMLQVGILLVSGMWTLCGSAQADSEPAVSASAPAASSAGDADTKFVPSLQLGIGTLGIGVHAGGMVAKNVSVRVGGNFFSLSRTQAESGIDYNAKLKLQSVDGLVDLYTGKSTAFHLTVGAIDNTSHVDANAKPTTAGSITINGNTYAYAPGVSSLTGQVKWSGVKPYIGIGFGRPAEKSGKVSFFSDFGVILSDTAKVKLTATGIADPSGTLQSDIAAQQAKTQKDINKLNVYPVIMSGIAISF